MQKFTVGLISDTHDLLRPEIFHIFDGCDFIIHAGDIGKIEIIDALEKIAPVIAVKGNCDRGELVGQFPQTEAVEIGEKSIYIIHDIKELDISLESGFDVIIYGHSHKPSIETKAEVLLVNPGSAGPKRFNLPISVGKLYISGKEIQAEIIELNKI